MLLQKFNPSRAVWELYMTQLKVIQSKKCLFKSGQRGPVKITYRSISGGNRDPKEFKRLSGRPDDPPRKAARKNPYENIVSAGLDPNNHSQRGLNDKNINEIKEHPKLKDVESVSKNFRYTPGLSRTNRTGSQYEENKPLQEKEQKKIPSENVILTTKAPLSRTPFRTTELNPQDPFHMISKTTTRSKQNFVNNSSTTKSQSQPFDKHVFAQALKKQEEGSPDIGMSKFGEPISIQPKMLVKTVPRKAESNAVNLDTNAKSSTTAIVDTAERVLVDNQMNTSVRDKNIVNTTNTKSSTTAIVDTAERVLVDNQMNTSVWDNNIIHERSKFKLVNPRFNDRDRQRVYSFGLVGTGALGFHKPNEGRRIRKYIHKPLRHQFGEENRVISAEAGYGFTLFYVQSDDNIKLFGCGINSEFQLGPIKADVVTYPTPIDIHIKSPKTKIVSLSGGRAHSAVATDSEGVFIFGSNTYGQCGRMDKEENPSSCIITQISSFGGETARKVLCGQDHTVFLTESGKVYSCGWGSEGQTGLGHTEHAYEPTLVKGDLNGENIRWIAGRCDTVLALNEKGELFGWGCNEFKQLIDDRDIPNVVTPKHLTDVNRVCGKIVDAAAGSSFCLVLNENGDVFVWGYGILGAGPALSKSTIPYPLPLTLFGANEYNPTCRPKRVFCGLDHMAVVNNSKHAYTWGKNKHGCLGIGTLRDQYFPYKLAVGADVLHLSCAVDHSVMVTNHT